MCTDCYHILCDSCAGNGCELPGWTERVGKSREPLLPLDRGDMICHPCKVKWLNAKGEEYCMDCDAMEEGDEDDEDEEEDDDDHEGEDNEDDKTSSHQDHDTK
jgi:hypothetical protein